MLPPLPVDSAAGEQIPIRSVPPCGARSLAEQPAPFSRLLREATAAAHARAEAMMWPPAATSDRLVYARWLLRHLGLIAPLEAGVEAHAAALAALGADPRPRSRRSLLMQDLALLGVAERSPPAPVPPVPDAAHALGMFYVLEGSRLGGRVLLRRVEAGIRDHGGATAFLAGGDTGPEPWRAFRGALDNFGQQATPAARAAVLRAANATFRAFEAWFAPLAAPEGNPA
jgi:heme oxygenase